jgi:hypothetical protein
MSDTRFNPEVWIHKESYVFVEGFTKNLFSLNPFLAQGDEDMPFMDTTTSSWGDTKTSFKYGKLVLMFFYQLF